jgi:oligoribonuclease
MEEVSRAPLVWLDMEMTGLEPESCVPLQVAIIITDGDLVARDSLEINIWQPDSVLERMDPFVRNMHTDNGLLELVRASTVGLGRAEQSMLELLSKHADYRKGVLCGNSIAQDRKFLRQYFPVFEGYLHYRMVDVSSLKELVVRWYGPGSVYRKPQSKHTALTDIQESIDELRHYRSSFMIPSVR